MREHYEAQLTTLNTEMIQMGALCEDAISGAIQALLEDDKHLAEKVGNKLTGLLAPDEFFKGAKRPVIVKTF